MLELSKNDKRRTDWNCQVTVAVSEIIPETISFSNVVGALELGKNKEENLFQIWQGKVTVTIEVTSHLSTLELPMEWSVFGGWIILPPTLIRHKKNWDERFLTSKWIQLWEPLMHKFFSVALPELLRPVKEISLQQLISKLEKVESRGWYGRLVETIDWSWLVIVVMLLKSLVKQRKCQNMYWWVCMKVRGENEQSVAPTWKRSGDGANKWYTLVSNQNQ